MPVWLVKAVVSAVSSMPLLVCVVIGSRGVASLIASLAEEVVVDQRASPAFARDVANSAIGWMNINRANKHAINCRVARDFGMKGTRVDFRDLVMVPLRCRTQFDGCRAGRLA